MSKLKRKFRTLSIFVVAIKNLSKLLTVALLCAMLRSRDARTASLSIFKE